jgi:hypothetical protein
VTRGIGWAGVLRVVSVVVPVSVGLTVAATETRKFGNSVVVVPVPPTGMSPPEN